MRPSPRHAVMRPRSILKSLAGLQVGGGSAQRQAVDAGHVVDLDRARAAAVLEHREREDDPQLLVDDLVPARPESRDEVHHVRVELVAAAQRAEIRHRIIGLLRAERNRPRHRLRVVRGLAAVLTTHAIVGERGELAVGVLDRFEIAVGDVHHLLARQATRRSARP